METDQEPKNKLFKTFAWISGLLCVLCCSLPILAVVIGISTLTALTLFLKKFSLVFLLLAVASFAVWYIQKRRAASCNINCASKHSLKKE